MTDMLTMIKSLGSQLRWAADLAVPEIAHHEDFVIVGMGGSGIGGDYVAAVVSDSPLRAVGHKNYAPLPGWVSRIQPLVVGVSYSGNTEETLSAVDEANGMALPLVALTTGGALKDRASAEGWPTVDIPSGLQPRAALGYLFGATLRVVGASSGRSDFVADLNEAADVADEITTEGSTAWLEAEQLAASLAGRASIIYGGGAISGAAAQRWKTQINENAKMPAWWSVLPELDHNEIVSWETLPDMTRETVAIVGLSDDSDAARVSERYRHTRNLTEYAVPWAGHVRSKGRSAAARIISLTAIGDLVSWMLAVNAGVDPVPVGTIEKLKKLLVEDEG
ncbi:MAG: bifunctional phosphoglucose/phosphomannose isomerase [Acidimicrobiia bacterium]